MRVLLRYRGDRRGLRAFQERQELVKAGLTRRDLVRMGLLTGGGVGGGLLLAERAVADDGGSLGALPPFTAFKDPLPILPPLPPATLDPPPRADDQPLPGEGRSELHQSLDKFPPKAFFATRIRANPDVEIHSAVPHQTVWGASTPAGTIRRFRRDRCSCCATACPRWCAA